MSVRRYTTAELLALRESPLVAKPDDLPSIEQWLEFVYLESDGVREKLRIPHSESANPGDHRQSSTTTKENKRNNRLQSATTSAPEASPMGAFSTGRPTLNTRNSTLSRAAGDDISLGPPKTVFASSRHNSRLSDLPQSSTDEDIETTRARFFSDRQANRRSGIIEKEGRDNRDSWTRAAERRALGGDDEGKAEGSKNDRYGRHDTTDGERRNGFGDKGDPRWSNTRGEERRQNGGGWREREQAKRNNGDRNQEERDPEWMMQDDPIVKKEAELNFAMPKTQEDFEKWKAAMKTDKKTKGEPEKEAEVPVEAPPAQPEPKPSLKLDGFEGGMFGGFNSTASAQPTPSSATPPATALPPKAAGKGGKTSRFASMFKPAAEEPPPPPPESDLQKAANGFAQTSSEDQEAFNRVLQMLGGTKLGGQPTPTSETPSAPISSAPSAPQSPPQPTRGGANGTKPKSRFFAAQPKSPEMQSPQQGGVSLGGEGLFDRGAMDEPAAYGGRAERPSQETPEPSNMFNALREQQPRPSSGRVNELAFDPPSRSAPSPDINIQNLLAQQRQRPQHTSHESQNLLNLLKKSDPTGMVAGGPPSHGMGSAGGARQHHQPADGGDQAQLQRWLDHQHQANTYGGSMPGMETHAPRPTRHSQQPPGLFDEQLMRNFPSREDLGSMPEPRRQPQRAPPGFYDEREIMMQQQQQLLQQQQQQQMRRNYADAPPQQMPPQQQQQVRRHPPPQQQQYPGGEYHITSPNPSSGPPGFSQHMPRHPPGFANLPPQHFSQREGLPPPPGALPPGFGPPPPQQQQSQAPPGFYNAPPPPPGFQNVRHSQDGSMLGMRGRGQGGYDVYEMGRR